MSGIAAVREGVNPISMFITKTLTILPLLVAAALWGQEQTTAPAPASPAPDSPATPTAKSNPQPPPNGISKDRLFYALPNFLTLENAADVPPLTTGQKFKAVAKGTFDPVEFGFIGATAGIAQAENSEATFGQGAQGYAKRYGLRFADSAIENFLAQAIFPSLLHQDPRYFQSGKGTTMHRVFYALQRVVVTRSDSGSRQFNYSEILGASTAAAISTYTYHPRNERNGGNLVELFGTQIGLDALGYELKEFWPDIRRWMHKSKPAPTP